MKRAAKALERYLNAATRGLFGPERAAVREELEANLLERVREFQVGGDSKDTALERALEEFGAPDKVSRGMREVYLMPNLMKGGALAGLLAVGAYLAVSSSAAGAVNVTFEGPCRENCAWMGMSYVDVKSLEQELRQQGLAVTRSAFTLSVQAGPGRPGEISISPNGGGDSSTAVFWKDKRLYVPTYAVLDLAQQSNLPARISGLVAPTLELGGARLSLSAAGRALEVSALLSRMVAGWLCSTSRPRNPQLGLYGMCLGTSSFNDTRWIRPRYTLALSKPKAMYAVLFPVRREFYKDLAKPTISLNWSVLVLQADAQGMVEFLDDPMNTQAPPEFAGTLEDFKAFKDTQTPRALLLELTGRLDAGAANFSVVRNPPPFQRASAASK